MWKIVVVRFFFCRVYVVGTMPAFLRKGSDWSLPPRRATRSVFFYYLKPICRLLITLADSLVPGLVR